MLELSVLKLLGLPVGSSEGYSLDGPVEVEGLIVKSELKGKCELMHIHEGVNVQFSNITISLAFNCEKCLEQFSTEISIDTASRQILLEAPADTDDRNDIFLINSNDQTIDLIEPLRQEIILHFPSIPVCSTSCKGICAFCGGEKNKKACNCKEIKVPENKPLSALKDLFKD